MRELYKKVRNLFLVYFPENSLRNRFALGMSWVIGGSIFIQGAKFAVGIIVARLLGLKDFGALAVIQSSVLMLANFGQAGIGLSATKYVASFKSTDKERTGRIIGFALVFTSINALILGISILVFTAPIVGLILPQDNLSIEFKVASGWLVFEMINAIQLRLLAGLEAFRSSTYINLWQGFLLVPSLALGAYYFGVVGSIISLSIVSILSCLIGQFFLIKECGRFDISISYRNLWEERSVLRMSAMVWFSGIAMHTTNWLVGILLARRPYGLAEFALFNAAGRFQAILLFFPARLFQVTVPILSNLDAEENRRGFNKVLMGAGVLGMIVTIAGTFFVFLYSEQLMSLYGDEFANASKVLRIVALGSLVTAAWTIASAGLWATGQSKQMFATDCIRGGLLLTICFAGLAVNAQGLAIAHLISYCVAFVVLMTILLRYMRRPFPYGNFAVSSQPKGAR